MTIKRINNLRRREIQSHCIRQSIKSLLFEGNGDEGEDARWPEPKVDDRFQVNRLTAMPGRGLTVAKNEKDSKFRATLRERGRQRRDGQNSYFPPPCRRVLAQAPKIYVSSPSLHPPLPCSVRLSVQVKLLELTKWQTKRLCLSLKIAIDSFHLGGGKRENLNKN